MVMHSTQMAKHLEKLPLCHVTLGMDWLGICTSPVWLEEFGAQILHVKEVCLAVCGKCPIESYFQPFKLYK